MAFFNIFIAALLLSLSVALSPIAAYTTIAQAPSSAAAAAYTTIAQAPSPAYFDHVSFNALTPMEEQAKDSQYLKAHMTAAVNQVELFLANEVEKRLNDPATNAPAKECLIVCKEVYESAVDAMKTGMESVSERDFFKANMDVSAFTTNIDTCNECFKEFQKFDDWAKGVGGDCLDKIVKYTYTN